jgi:hypothetical protein
MRVCIAGCNQKRQGDSKPGALCAAFSHTASTSTLLLHCCCTVLTLSLHYCFVSVALLSQLLQTITSKPLIQCCHLPRWKLCPYHYRQRLYARSTLHTTPHTAHHFSDKNHCSTTVPPLYHHYNTPFYRRSRRGCGAERMTKSTVPPP